MTTTTFDLEDFKANKQLGIVRGIAIYSRSVFGTISETLYTLVAGNITLFTAQYDKQEPRL